MNKLLIGAIIALLLLALLPIKSEPFTFINTVSASNTETVSASIADYSKEMQKPLIQMIESDQRNESIQINETDPMENSVLTLAENEASDYEVIAVEVEQEITDDDRGIFISIGAILLFGILLILPLHLQRL